MMEPTLLDMLLEARVPSGFGGRWYGVYPALVSDLKDPAGQGRIKITLPWSPDTDSTSYETWARLATFMGGNNRGSWFIPDVNDEVLVVFLAGNPRHPYVIGSLWNGKDVPPHTMDATGQNNLKMLRSRNGIKITLDDTDGRERLTLETPGGQTVTLKDAPSSVEIHDSNGNVIRMEAGGITITGAHVTITAPAVTVTSALATFSGTVTATAFIPPPGTP